MHAISYADVFPPCMQYSIRPGIILPCRSQPCIHESIHPHIILRCRSQPRMQNQPVASPSIYFPSTLANARRSPYPYRLPMYSQPSRTPPLTIPRYSDLIIPFRSPAPIPQHRTKRLDAIAIASRHSPGAHTRPLDNETRSLAQLALQFSPEEERDGAPGCGDVDDAVPEAHERQDDAGGVAEGEGDHVRVEDGVDSVDGAGDPGHEQGDEEQQRDFRVAKGGGVGLVRGSVSRPLDPRSGRYCGSFRPRTHHG